jgi:hypothetical protein
MVPTGSEYSVILQRADLRRSTQQHPERRPQWTGRFTRLLRARSSGVAVLSAAVACALAVTFVSVRVGDSAPVSDVTSSIELAQAFTVALNAHDVDALVELFTEDDSGPTLSADRYAWQKSEIRLWAQQQVAANIHVTAYDFQVTDRGAAWNADVFRDDWQEWGVSLLPVANTIWVHEGKLADFTSTLRDPQDAERLSGLWRPDTSVRR